jgi:hypothetical protein
MIGISRNGSDMDLIALLEREIRISELPQFLRTTPEYVQQIIIESCISIISRDKSRFIKEDEFREALIRGDYLGFMPYAEY